MSKIIKREYPSQPIVGVGAVIVKEGKVLLVKRGKSPSFGEWSIPGGAVNVGESLEQALLREIKEETELVINIGKPIYFNKFYSKPITKKLLKTATGQIMGEIAKLSGQKYNF